MFKPKTKTKKVDVLNNVDGVNEFLDHISDDVKALKKQLVKLEELEHESQVARSGLLHVNLETQGEVLDHLLLAYEDFHNDVDINGERVKIVAEYFLKRAKKAGMNNLVEEKKKKSQWKMMW